MQKNIKIKTGDKKFYIHGTLNYKRITKKIVIFVHGTSGGQNEHQFFNAVDFFNKRGVATFRFDLYSWLKKARKLHDCSLGVHIQDLNTVVKHFSKTYSQIYLVGHSWGGPVVLESDLKKVQKIILWDSSINLSKIKDIYHYDKKLKSYVIEDGIKFVINKRITEDFDKNGDYKEIAEKIDIPVKVICAGKGILYKDWTKAIKGFNLKSELCLIKEASHCFDEEGAEESLFKETYKWIK